MANTSFLKRKLIQARKASFKLSNICDEIAIELQPCFNEEITVFEQAGDGFVVLIDAVFGDESPKNIPVESIIVAMSKGETEFQKYSI